jgi:hypothetical protein
MTYLTCPKCGTCCCPVMAKIYLGDSAEPDRQDAYCPICERVFSKLSIDLRKRLYDSFFLRYVPW